MTDSIVWMKEVDDRGLSLTLESTRPEAIKVLVALRFSVCVDVPGVPGIFFAPESTFRRLHMHTYEGDFSNQGQRICIVVSRFNDLVTERLLGGALDGLRRHGLGEDQITLVRVPGAWEIPLACKKASLSLGKDGSKHFAAIIALGAVIRGQSAHFDYVCAEVSKGVFSVGQESNTPTVFGVLTCNSVDEALDRAGGKHGNKGFEAAMASLELISLHQKLDEVWL